MSITYKFVVTQIKIKPEENGLQNVVKEIIWAMKANDGTNEVMAASVIANSIPFAPPQSGSFKKFEDFTEDEISSWIESNVSDVIVDALKARLAKLLEEKNNQEIAVTPPWISQA